MISQPRKAAITFVFITMLLDVLAIGIIIPVFPALLKKFTGGDTASAAYYLGLFGFGWAFMQFFAAPILGNLSDRFGRRPVMLLGNLGMGLDYIFMALAPSLPWLFVGRLISGVTAGTISAAQAYIADVTTAENRASSFGLIGAAWGIGFVFGPAVGGILGKIDIQYPFFLAAILSLLNFLYGYFVLPESHPVERRTQFRWSDANPWGALKLLRSNSLLLTLGMIYFLLQLGHYVLNTTFVLYGDHRYGWGPDMAGYTLMGVGICGAIVQGGLIKPIIKFLGEYRALIIGLGIGSIGMALYGSAPTAYLFWAVAPFMAFWGLAGPSLQALATTHVLPENQGKLQGAFASLMGIAGMMGPPLFSFIFGWSVENPAREAPGFAFYVSAFLIFTAMLLAIKLRTTPETRAAQV
jgi:MFS transporter, DHA1 family, tetracycline resistance protein